MAVTLPAFLNRFMSSSTRSFVAEARSTPGYTLRDLVHGYLYLRFTYLYIGVATGEHRLARWLAPLGGLFRNRHSDRGEPAAQNSPARRAFADTYHGKVVPLDTASRLVTVDRDIERRDLERVIPYTRARDIVLKNPDHIVVLNCPCRMARKNPCLPLDVCLVVGEPFASFALEHHPGHARRITPAEAVEILRAEDERGHAHHAFFKDAVLNRFYAICNCCSCCCGAMQAHQHGTPMLASSGYVCEIDQELCSACGDCVHRCQFHALETLSGVTTVNEQACLGCGVCVGNCAYGAATLRRDERRGMPLEVCTLLKDGVP
ncbi:MAG: 4Fe-4S ferredoxin [Bacteroidetes bacterium]|nr:4Fe-4S ferredoxin [Bacteroidota bacterium]